MLFPISVLAHDLSFDITSRQGNEVATGKVYVKGQKYRIECDGEAEYGIVREDIKRWWAINPEERTYVEMAYHPAVRPRIDEREPGEVERTYLGTEKVMGRKTLKYYITVKDGKVQKKFYQWTDPVLKMPVKIADVAGKWTIEYSNFKRFVPDSLFELPSGYSIASGWAGPFMRIYSSIWLLCTIFLVAYYLQQYLKRHAEV